MVEPPTLIYTEHARDQMEAREISEEAVGHILNAHDTTLPRSRRRPGHQYIGEYGGRRLKVVVDDTVSAVVITTYWMDDPRRG